MIKLILSSIDEYISLKKEYNNKQADIEVVNAAAKRFAQCLNEYIDYRIRLAFDDRRKLIAEKKISLAEELNSTVKETVKSIHSIQALNSAPPPPESEQSMKEFIEEYNEWYEEKRKKGISIE